MVSTQAMNSCQIHFLLNFTDNFSVKVSFSSFFSPWSKTMSMWQCSILILLRPPAFSTEVDKLAFLDSRHAVECVRYWKNPNIDYCILYSWQGIEFKTANKWIHPIAFPLSLARGCTFQEWSEAKIGAKKIHV